RVPCIHIAIELHCRSITGGCITLNFGKAFCIASGRRHSFIEFVTNRRRCSLTTSDCVVDTFTEQGICKTSSVPSQQNSPRGLVSNPTKSDIVTSHRTNRCRP